VISFSAIVQRLAAPWGKRDPLDVFLGPASRSSPVRHDGLLLLLGAATLLILMLASGSLLRLLTKMNPGVWARWGQAGEA
jgi:hypothetical protein